MSLNKIPPNGYRGTYIVRGTDPALDGILYQNGVYFTTPTIPCRFIRQFDFALGQGSQFCLIITYHTDFFLFFCFSRSKSHFLSEIFRLKSFFGITLWIIHSTTHIGSLPGALINWSALLFPSFVLHYGIARVRMEISRYILFPPILRSSSYTRTHFDCHYDTVTM